MSLLTSKLLRLTKSPQIGPGPAEGTESDENHAQRQVSDEDVYRNWVGLWSLKEERAQASRDATLRRLSERRQQLSSARTRTERLQKAPTEASKPPPTQLHIADSEGRAICGIEAGMAPLSFATNSRIKVNAKSVSLTAGSKICSSCKSRAIEYAVNTADKERADYEVALNAAISSFGKT